jgi:exodeoxyribonuclease V alpha subunit
LGEILEFKGVVVANPYNSEDYKIYGLIVDYYKYPNIKVNKYGNVSIAGNIHNLEEGVEYKIKATEESGKYGMTYKIVNIEMDRPKTETSIRLFLSQILDSQQQVEEIMREYPDIIDRVINNRLEDVDLKKLYNIGEFRFNVIKRRIIENFALADLVNEFKGYIEFKILKVLYDKYGSIERIKEVLVDNPYKCLCGLSRIAFKTADKILLEFNEECKKMISNGEKPPLDFTMDLLTSPQRQKAAIMFLLEENENDGNTRMDVKELRKQSETLANKCIEHFVNIVKNDEDIYFDKKLMTVALKETYNTEQYIAERITEGLKVENKWNIKEKDYSKFDDIQLTNEQSLTIPMICNDNISILRGGAGMGKSQSTKAVINMLKDNSKSFLLLAPTGRAAKVISEFTSQPASTIHRGLLYNPAMGWGYNENNKLVYDMVIVDESSMIDVFLMKRLIEAIDFNNTKVLFVGDADQAPSVSAGNVFYDMINSGIIPTNTLTVVFRYGKGGILTIATKTRMCEKFLEGNNQPERFGEDKGYMFIPTPQEKIINNVIALYKKLLSTNYSREDILILSAYNIGEYGTVNINKFLQPISNPNVQSKGKYIEMGDTKFYENDLVIQIVNNYKAVKYNPEFCDENDKVFIPNGEIGRIVKIGFNEVVIKFDEEIVYSKAELTQIKLAYSISILKSQGGQAKVVILLTPKAHTYMLNSNLIYVGQTRAKEKVFHFGETDTVNRCIKKKADFNRNTYLKELLKEL